MVYGQCLFEALDGIEVAPLDPNDPFTYHVDSVLVKPIGTRRWRYVRTDDDSYGKHSPKEEELRNVSVGWLDALPEGVDIGNYVFAFEEVNYTGLHPTLEWAQIEYDLVKYIGGGYDLSSLRSVGELCLKGPAVMKGYLGNEAATNATMVDDGCMCAY
ncbi:hypothetical protein Tco_1240130 [Tanacetum coccineum]